MKKWLLYISIILLAGCSQTAIDWVDFLEFRGNQFQVSHYAEISDPNFIGEPIGEIKKRLKDHVKNPKYSPKNGDAAYLEPGTKLYSVINHSHLIAVKDTDKINGYKIYVQEDRIPNKRMLDQPDQLSLLKVEVYEEVEHNQFIFKKVIEKTEDLQKVKDILVTGKSDSSVVYQEEDPQSKSFALILYSSSPLAEKYAIYFDGNQYFDQNNQVLSKELEKYLIGTEDHPSEEKTA
ncbi:hypothetical protein MUB24_03230 [Lederbergia sp. NSJ-179]|uniref:hypothetical protein n=1 Tax=Lederbergia sp. NSJ-179 TaxID=2931402 RepID=UPI001FD32468|nr:hypothetical protein [Lederbergia sp. NSJ-179]MCJ7839941.1 hypothetical protein [Lederbergia sp. NSJ-179]